MRTVIETGEVIEEYPEDNPYPSKLMLDWIEERPLRVVVAVKEISTELIIVTVYEPDPEMWGNNFKQRRK